jgi:DNA helicase-2/ATP-dependent DNA helicase PcrA
MEARTIPERIQNEVFQKKRTFRDFVILYRTNAQSRLLEEELRRSGMPYMIVGGVRFYERKEIKDILAYLKVISNPSDSVSLKRIINFPTRGIGQNTLKKLELWSYQNGKTLFEATQSEDALASVPKRSQASLQAFKEMMQKYIALKEKISPNELVHTLVDESGLLSMYKEDISIESQSREDNIREFLAAVSDYVSNEEAPTLATFLEQVSLVTDVDTWDDKGNSITLMTLHSAKGLEFPVVFITGLEEGLFPVFRSMEEPEALEEERRLFYVGLTRAKEKVYLLWSQTRNLYNDTQFRLPSRFLDELDPQVIENEAIRQYGGRKSMRRKERAITELMDESIAYETMSQAGPDLFPGVIVDHEMFGRGVVVHVSGAGKKQKVTVRFESGTEKKFLSEYARFTILDQ